MNRTLTETMRAMLTTTNLPNAFWAEVAKITYYEINRLPFIVIKLKTSMEMWTRKLADNFHLNVFGCFVYVT